MEEIKCKEHQQLCYLKTGTKEGPNYGVSFYVCPVSCGFFKQTDIQSRKCPQHPDQIIDLQAVFFGKNSGEKRQYHRCHGRTEGQSWCGYSKKLSVKPLKDNNGQITDKTGQSHNSNVKETKTPPKDASGKSSSSHTDQLSSRDEGQVDHDRQSQSRSKSTDLKNPECEGYSKNGSKSDESENSNILEGVGNLSIADNDSDDDKINKAMANLSTHEDKEEDVINVSSSSGNSGSLPSPGLSGANKTSKISPRTDIAEKYSKYKIKKKTPVKEATDSPKDDGNTETNISLSLSERIRQKSGDSIKSSSISSCSSVSENRGEEVIDLVSSSDEDDELSQKPQRYQPSPQVKGQKVIQNSNSGSESIIKDALKQVQGQQGQPTVAMATQHAAQIQKSQFIAPKPSGLTSAAQYELQLDMDRRTDLQRQLEKLKTVVATAKMSALPDKGEKLRRQVDDIERALKAVNRKIANAQSAGSNPPAINIAPKPADTIQQPSAAPASSQQQTAQYKTVQIVQPGGQTSMVKIPVSANAQPISNHQAHNPQGLKQTSILAHAQTIPPHIMQQLYAANPQQMQLYGGRMTNQRLREVTSITAGAIEKLHKQLETCPDEDHQLEDPEGLKVPLMVHQRQALAWLVWREKQQPAGGILADDMGLGKTLTMISLIMKQKQLKEGGTDEDKQVWLSRDKQLEKLSKNLVKSQASLVICPASLIHQWKSEIERRVRGSRLKVMLYHGPDRESDVLKLADNDVVLTTYNLIAKEVGAADINAENPAIDEDLDEDEKQNELSAVKHKSDSKLLRIAWERIILDEGHNIKNHKSLTAVSVCRLRAGFRWALTGTPIQNKLLDIYSLLRFLRCSPFDEYKLWKKQVERDSGHSRLNVLVKCLLLRRTKTQVDKAGKPLVSLPSKSVKQYEISLSGSERKVYEKIFAESKSVMKDYLRRHEEKEMGISHKPGSATNNPFQDKSPSKVGGQGSQVHDGLSLNTNQRPGGQMILVMLLRLRQCCCHLSLMKDALEEEVADDEGLELDLVEQMRGMGLEEEEKSSEPSLTKSSQSFLFEKNSLSTKVEAVMEKLKEIRESSDKKSRQKSVIVSQWTKMLDIVAVHLREMGIKYSVIQGNIPAKKRNEFVEDFNTNPRGSEVMLVSLRAGGVGLNLIGGNHLFLLDQHWNPALEDQACDRIYRVGQTKDVVIHRFLCKDTVEEKIVQLQERKKRLADNVLTGSKATNSKLTLQDLRMIFGV